MTIKELYNWAIINHYENAEILITADESCCEESFSEENIRTPVYRKNKNAIEIYIEF